MKKLFMLLVILASSSLLFAQHNYEDVVYLKNGSVIRGIIIEQVPNQSIKIETADRNIFVYRFDEIEKLSKEVIRGTRNGHYRNSSSRSPSSGYIGILDVGYAVGIGDDGYDFVNLTMINGYKFNPHFSLGFGTGAKFYHSAEAILIPFFTNFQVNFINKAVSPYFALNVGYSFNASDDFEPTGFLINPSIGVHFGISDGFGINLSVGYDGQWAELYNDYYYYYESSSEILSGISFKIGFVF
jgi:hypothetical protein